MIVELPEWQSFAPGATPWIPDASGAGRIVAVLAPAAARRDGWAVRVAVDLAGLWGDAGQRVVLADGVLEYPMLHREVGLPNDEGVTDAALFGASITRVARPVPGRSFFFVSAGSPAGNADSVAGSPRWHRLRDGFKDAGVTLVLFVREGCAAEEELTRGADDIVVLAGSGEDVPPSARRMADRVRMILGPEPRAASPAEVDPDPEAELEQPLHVSDDPHVAEGGPDATEADPAYDPFGGPPDADVFAAELGGGRDAATASETLDDHLHFTETNHAVPGADASMPAETRSGDVPAVDGPVVHETPDGRGHGTLSGSGAAGVSPEVGYAPIHSSRRKRGSDSGTGKKLIWIGIVLVAVILLAILWGGLGSG